MVDVAVSLKTLMSNTRTESGHSFLPVVSLLHLPVQTLLLESRQIRTKAMFLSKASQGIYCVNLD